MAAFKNLALNDKFWYDQQIWIKVTPVKKSCCKVLFNAHVDGNKDIKKVFDANTEVTPHAG